MTRNTFVLSIFALFIMLPVKNFVYLFFRLEEFLHFFWESQLLVFLNVLVMLFVV